MSGGWNVFLALPEWILGATVLIVLVMDARTRFDKKAGLARVTWFGLAAATLWVGLQGLGLPGGDDITERRKPAATTTPRPAPAAAPSPVVVATRSREPV